MFAIRISGYDRGGYYVVATNCPSMRLVVIDQPGGFYNYAANPYPRMMGRVFVA